MKGKGKLLPFHPPLLTGPDVENQREGEGAQSGGQSRVPVRIGAAGPLGSLLSPSLLPAPPDLDPSPSGGEAH